MSSLPGAAKYPLCIVYLDCAYVSGQVILAAVDTLPVSSVSVLVGHDLASAQVVPYPIIPAVPLLENNTQELEQNHPDLFPSCAITRSMSKAVSDASENEEKSDPFLPDSSESLYDVLTEEFTLKDFFDHATVNTPIMNSHSDVVTFNNTPITREKLIQEQACDSELETYF